MLHRSHSATGLLALLATAMLATYANAAEDSGSGAAGKTAALSSCHLPDVTRPARCGTFEVPENPDRPDGRRLQISVAVIPATGTARRDPIVPLMGGPGEDTISAAAYYAKQFAPLLDDRDLLLVDQRGTGQSGRLRCDLYSSQNPAANLRHFLPPEAVKKCEQTLSARTDLTQYTYTHFARDLDHIRTALGYESLNLSAGSYGTRAAQVLVRTYPRSVRTVFMGSIVPIDVTMPLPMAKAAQASLEDLFKACKADSACNSAFPQLRDEFRQVAARLEEGVRVQIPGHTGTVPLDRGRVAEWFRAKLYRPSSATALPWLIHRAHAGDWTPIAEGILSDARAIDEVASLGLLFSITCAEDVAFLREQDVAPQTRGTFLGDYRVREQQAACKLWPKAPIAADYRSAVRSSVPAMFVSGDMDAGTPLWFTAHAAPGFSERVEIVLGGKGHTEWSDCLDPLYEQFVRSGTARGIDPSSCKPVPRPPFKTQ